MKKVIFSSILFILMLGFQITATAQRPKNSEQMGSQKMKPEDRVDMQITKLNAKLDFSDEQIIKLRDPLIKLEKEKMALMMNENADPMARRELSLKADKIIESVLTKEQVAAYETIKQERRDRMQEMRNNQ